MDETAANKAKSLSQDRFGRFAEGYVSSQTHAAAPELELLREMASPQPHWIVLDVATGGGHTALALQPFVKQVIASDLTWLMLNSARPFSQQVIQTRIQEGGRDTALEFHQADAEALPYAADSINLVTCRIAPHHFPDAGLFVQEAARILKPGGRLVVQDHLLPEDPEACSYLNAFERLRDPSHQRSFTQKEWESMFIQAGLIVERIEVAFKTHAFLPFVERQGCTPEVIAELAAMMRDAPPVVRAWRNPRGFERDLKTAAFSDRHILIAGKKEGMDASDGRQAEPDPDQL